MKTILCILVSVAGVALAQGPPHPTHRMFHLRDFRVESGATLPDAKVSYVTYGTLNGARANAILLPSAYGDDHHGYDFLIGDGKALDTTRYFLIATEMFGNGYSSSPSNTPPPFDGPRFPPIAIRDNVAATYRLVTEEFGVAHLRAVIGFSMGAEQAFQWAVSYPAFVDVIVPYCGTARTYPHGAVRLESAISALKADAGFKDGDYTEPPVKGLEAFAYHWAPWVFSQEWWRRELFKPGHASVEDYLRFWIHDVFKGDANDYISQALTWEHHNIGDTPGSNGDVERALRTIRARVLYMPCQTDLYFPIGDAEYESRFIPHVKLVPIPSLWGHTAGGGINPADNDFLNAKIRDFVK